jgi:hypothetical protein
MQLCASQTVTLEQTEQGLLVKPMRKNTRWKN